MINVLDIDVESMVDECLALHLCPVISVEEFIPLKEMLLHNGFIVEYRNIDVEKGGDLILYISQSGFKHKVSFFNLRKAFPFGEINWFNFKLIEISRFLILPDNISESDNNIEEVLL